MLIHEQAGERLVLLPERAIFRPQQRQLLIADPHFGKSATFRSHGIPIPCGTTDDDLRRLSSALRKTGAIELVVLGDFLHAERGRSDELHAQFTAWRAEHADLKIRIVRGNHDRSAGDPATEWSCHCEDEGTVEGPFVLRHHPREEAAAYVLAGHLHPALRLSDGSGARANGPCFWFGSRIGILPAFSSFTGGAGFEAVAGDAIYMVGPDRVVAISTVEVTRPRRGRVRSR
jgi:DNA ligase-associated metallophosphoesterase